MVQCGRRHLTPAEARYAAVELELLDVSWASKKCRLYLLGRDHFELLVDHRPLVSILDKKTLDQIENRRLQRLKESLCLYSFTISWVKGKTHHIPDALSRAPVMQPENYDKMVENEHEYHMHQVIIV